MEPNDKKPGTIGSANDGRTEQQFSFEAHSLEEGVTSDSPPALRQDTGYTSSYERPVIQASPTGPDAPVVDSPATPTPSPTDIESKPITVHHATSEPTFNPPASPLAPEVPTEQIPATATATPDIAEETEAPKVAMVAPTKEEPVPPPEDSKAKPIKVDENHLIPAHLHRVRSYRWFWPVVIIVGALLVLGAAAVITARQLHANDISKTFQTALEQNLRTKTFMKQTMYSPTNFTDATYDMSDVKKPIVSAKTAVSQGTIVAFASQGYSNYNDTFVKFMPKDPTPAQAPVVNKWIVVRKDGFLDKTADAAVLQLYDARTLSFEPLIVGNFSTTQQKTILNTIATQKLYTFNPQAVTAVQENGQKLLKYPVTMSTAAITAVTKKTAEQVGYGLAPTFADSKATIKAEFLVDRKAKRIVRIKTTRNSQPVTYFYTNYDMAKIADAPEPELGWGDYTRLMAR